LEFLKQIKWRQFGKRLFHLILLRRRQEGRRKEGKYKKARGLDKYFEEENG
jgi:hypothetical protein